AFVRRRQRFERNLATLERASVQLPSGARVLASQVLRQPDSRLQDMVTSRQIALEISAESAVVDVTSVETAVKYEGYLRRQTSEIARARKDEGRRIPQDFPFDRVPGLSREMVQRFSQVRPDTLGQALRIPGATPAAVAVVSAYIGRLPI